MIVSTFAKTECLNSQGRKILFISLSRTGSTDYAAEMASQMSYIDPWIVCSSQSSETFDVVDRSIETYSGVISFLFQSCLFFFRCPALIDSYKSKSDHLIIYFPVFHPWNLIISIWAGIKDVPVVTTIHDYHTHVGEKNRISELLQKRQMDISDKIIFLTESEKNKALSYHPKYQKKSLVLLHPLLDSHANHTLAHNPDLKFLFLGRLKAYKGYQLLINASNHGSIQHITIAGSGDTAISSIDKVSVINKHLSNSEITQLIESHHVLVLPYKDTSQSGVLTLGIDACMPMIISQLPGLQEQISESACTWIEPNKNALRDAMLRLQNEPEYFNSIKINVTNYKKDFKSKWESNFKEIIRTIRAI